MSSAENLSLALTSEAQQLLHALVELGHLDHAALDALAVRLQGAEEPLSGAHLRREVAALLFEVPPSEEEQARLLTLEWRLLFG